MSPAVNIIVAGTVRVPQSKLPGLRPHIQSYVEACRQEDGCLRFSFAEDICEPGLLRVFEVWRDVEALHGHFQTPHVAAWRLLWPEFEVHERKLSRFDVSDAVAV